MKRKQFFKILLGLFLLPAIPCQAQLLWKISGEQLQKPSYLFGTHHFASVDITKQIPGFDKAFNSCKQMYGELVVAGEGTKEAMQFQLMAAMFMPKDTTFRTLFTEEEYLFIDEQVKKYTGTGVKNFERFKPTAISVLIIASLAGKTMDDFNPDQVVDVALQERAIKKKKKVFALESSDFQADLLLNTPLEKQASDLLTTLKAGDLTEQVEEMYNIYIKQDLDGILKYVEEYGGMDASSSKAFLFDRNHNWAEQLQAVLPQKATFIAVGAAHLPGEEGLIALLRKMGYTVEPVQ